MKIAFINDSCEHLGIEYISSVLKSEGHQTKLFVDPLLFDDEFISIKPLNRILDFKNQIIDNLKDYNPDLISISIVTSSYPWASEIASMIKNELDVPIIAGGIHPSSVPEIVIQNENIDMVCIGEGEYPMLELANSMDSGRIDHSIKNVWFKVNNKIIQNETRPLIENLDTLPFPDKDLYYSESPHFYQSYYIATNRGCPYSCSYCCNSYLRQLYKNKGSYLRQRSVSNVILELRQAKARYNISPIFFLDDCFGYDMDWLKEFSYEYRKNIGIKFYCMMFPNKAIKNAVPLLKTAGCGEIEIGVQSWDEDIRKHVFKRNIDNKSMIEAMKLIKESGINLVTGDILGYPGQTEEHIVNAAKIYAEIKPDRTYSFILKYYPKTDITEQSVRQNLMSADNYAEIQNGLNGRYLSNDKRMSNKKVLQYIFLFNLIRILPKKAINFIIKNKLYRYFPLFLTPAILSAMNNLSTSTFESKVNRRSALLKYKHFTWKKFLYRTNNIK